MNVLHSTDLPQVGDVWTVATHGWQAAVIRFWQGLRGLPTLDNHVVVVHHMDKDGHWWGLEGRPGGVGWCSLAQYRNNPATVTNAAQPKTADQRAAITTAVEQMLGTPYDWFGIGADALRDLRLDLVFAPTEKGTPGHVVCSSLAAYVYRAVGLAHPMVKRERLCQPADWTIWNKQQGWKG